MTDVSREDSALAPRTWLGLTAGYWLLIAGMFVNRLGAFVLPFLSIYLEEHEGLSAREVGIVIGAWGVGSVIAALVGGQLADRWGRKRTMLLSLCGGALVLLALSRAHGAAPLTALALVLGAVAELYRPAVAAAITDLAPPEHRARAFGYLTWSYNLGFAVSPVLAGLVARRFGFAWLFYGDAATMVAGALVIAWWTRETRPATTAGGAKAAGVMVALADARLRPMLIAALLTGVSIVQVVATLGPLMRADGIDLERYGRILALNGLGIVLVQPWLVPRAERFGVARVLPVSAALFCWGIGLHAWAETPLAHSAVVAVWTLGEVVLFPLSNALVAELAPPHLRGRYQGLYWMAWASANVLGPSLGRELHASFGPRGWALLLISCGAISSYALHVAIRRSREREAAPLTP